MKQLSLPTLVTLALASLATAQEAGEPLEGHSSHGEVFNEGPRQAAYLHADSYNVDFPISASTEEIQTFFNQGVAFLHGFWFFEAERTFRHIAALDPDCPMAYWGMAMANVDNEDRAAGFARVAWLKRGLGDKREQRYIDMIARFHEVEGPETPKRLDPELDEEKLEKESEARGKRRKSRAQRLARDYEALVWAYPEDVEAKALLVNRLWLNNRFGVPTSSRQANDALLQQVFTERADHPAHHYRIHLWDSKENAEHVVDAALSSGPSSPKVAHMWHMGGHIFAQLGRHTDAAWQQEASARVDHAHMIRDWVLPDQIHNFAHNNEWCTRSLRNHGRVSEAISLAKNMVELPRHPRYNMLDERGSANYGRRRLLEVLELFEQWEELVSLSQTMYLEPSEEAGDRADRAYMLAKAHAYLEDWAGFEAEVTSLEGALAAAKLDRVEALEEAEDSALAEDKGNKEINEAMTAVLEEHQRELSSMRDKVEALAALRGALEGEDLEDNLSVLKKRGFDRAHLAELCLGAGETEQAVELARDAAKNKKGVLREHATLAHVLFETGEAEEALELFDELREWTGRTDLSLPVMQRLAPLAEARELPADWRPAARLAADIPQSARPDLDSLGPLRWTPPAAPDWSLAGGLGSETSLSDYEGRPVLVIFFLGFGCVHCVDQLLAFAPEYERFQQAGIELVAIGTDSVEELKESQTDRSEDEAYPFPILADPDLDTFRAYRAYDDFEAEPLHGTYLVDGNGRVRWIDISYEPFMDWEFLLEESQRLLGLPEPGTLGPLSGSPESGLETSSGGQE